MPDVACTPTNPCLRSFPTRRSSDLAACSAANQNYLGDGTACTPDNPCPGACCNPQTGMCFFTAHFAASAGHCVTDGPGLWQAASCMPDNPCPHGACCNKTTGMCMNSGPDG